MREHIPTLSEELERKTLEKFEELLTQYAGDRITFDQMKIALEAVWDIASGLISGDAMTDLGAAIPEQNPINRYVFTRGKEVVVLLHNPLKGSARLLKAEIAEVREIGTDEIATAEVVGKLIEKLTSKGWIER